jgi:hypothetical protein
MMKEVVSGSSFHFLAGYSQDLQDLEDANPDWTNLEEGIPGWIYSLLQLDKQDCSRRTMCIPDLIIRIPNQPYLSYYSLIAHRRIADTIGSLDTPITFPHLPRLRYSLINDKPSLTSLHI